MTKVNHSTDDQVKFKCFEVQVSILSAQRVIDEYLVKIETVPWGQLGSGKRKSLDRH